MKLPSTEWLKEKIEADDDLPCEAGFVGSVEPTEITFEEMRTRGVSEDVQEFMLRLSSRLDRNPHLPPIPGYREHMHAFGIGPRCQCGERGLEPGEALCEYSECAEED